MVDGICSIDIRILQTIVSGIRFVLCLNARK